MQKTLQQPWRISEFDGWRSQSNQLLMETFWGNCRNMCQNQNYYIQKVIWKVQYQQV